VCLAGLAPAALVAAPAKGKVAAKTVARSAPVNAPANPPSRPVMTHSYSPVSISAPSNAMAVAIGRGQLVNLPSAMKDVFVADDKIADVQVKSNNQLYVYGAARAKPRSMPAMPQGR
jgi:pilus assembly protein CpaC